MGIDPKPKPGDDDPDPKQPKRSEDGLPLSNPASDRDLDQSDSEVDLPAPKRIADIAEAYGWVAAPPEDDDKKTYCILRKRGSTARPISNPLPNDRVALAELLTVLEIPEHAWPAFAKKEV